MWEPITVYELRFKAKCKERVRKGGLQCTIPKAYFEFTISEGMGIVSSLKIQRSSDQSLGSARKYNIGSREVTPDCDEDERKFGSAFVIKS